MRANKASIGAHLNRALAVALGAVLLAGVVWTPSAKAASPTQIANAVAAGLASLYSQQKSSGCPGAVQGCWSYSNGGPYYAAPTGAAVFAFLGAKSSWGAQAANYQTAVTNGINYLLANAATITVSTRDDGVNICPGGSGACTGVYWVGEGELTYSTGIVAAAVDSYGLALGAGAMATTSGPLAGMTYGQIAQGISNEFVATQSTSADLTTNGGRYVEYGGWRYGTPGYAGDSDTSTTQWAVYSFIFDESLGATEPASTKTNLAHWLSIVQEPSTAGALAGGVCYQSVVANSCQIGPDNSDTGGWLLAQQWLGTPASNTQVQAALTWLNSNWTTQANSSWLGNFGQPYAMLADYKGLETTIGLTATTNITTLLSSNCGSNLPSGVACNWYQDYEQWLVTNQNGFNTTTGVVTSPAGWAGYAYWTDPLSTAFDLTILSAAAVPAGLSAPAVSVPALSAIGLGVLALLLVISFIAMRNRNVHTS